MFNNKMTKIVIRVVAVIIALLLVVPLLANVFAHALTDSEKQSQIDKVNGAISQLQDQINDITNQQKELQNSIANANATKKTATEQKKQLDAQMNLIQQEIDVKQSLIDQYNNQIVEIDNRIADVEQQIASKMDQYYSRARSNFENGTASFLEMLFSSNDFSDFLVRLDMIEAINAADSQFINGLEDNKTELSSLRTTAQESKTQQLILQRELGEKQDTLSQKINESSKIISDIENGITDDKQQLEQADAQWDKLNKELEKQLSSLDNLKNYVGGSFIWPTAGIYKISCKFGSRIHPITKKKSFHYGVDIAAPKNTPILAANSGTVITAAYSSVYGNYVIIDHGGGKTTLYAHMTKYVVSKSSEVEIGQTIGYVGSTGWSTGAHLHYEIRENGTAKDPLSYYNVKFIYV